MTITDAAHAPVQHAPVQHAPVPAASALRRGAAGRSLGKVLTWVVATAVAATVTPHVVDRYWTAPRALEEARAAFAAHDHELAAELARQAFVANPGLTDAPAVLLAAEAAQADTASDWAALVPSARRLASTRPHDAADVGNAALVMLGAGHCEEAVTLFRRRIALGGDDGETRVSLAEARLCADGGDPKRAAAVLDGATGTAAGDPHLLLSRAVLRAAAGRPSAARADLDTVAHLAGDQVGLTRRLSCVASALAAVDGHAGDATPASVLTATRPCRQV